MRATSHARRIIRSIVFSYLYTAYMRVIEMVEKYKGKSRSEGKLEVEKKYEDLKKVFTEMYNKQIC